jgi:probable DNA repair protein
VSTDAAWATLERGAVVVTTQARLARELLAGFERRQQAAGRQAWETPDVLPLANWLEKLWLRHGDRLLLNPAQELALWAWAIRASDGDHAPLLNLDDTAQAAAEAWRLAHAYALPWGDAAWEQSQETAAFHGWAARVSRQCRRQGWITAAELPAAVTTLLQRGIIAPPAVVWWAGFEPVLPPAQQALRQALAASGGAVDTWPAPAREGRLGQATSAEDAAGEMTAAAAWAHALYRENPQRRIGVVAPALDGIRELAERAFRAEFHPGEAPWAVSAPAFHLSLGRPLAQWPLIAAALELLAWAASAPGTRLELALATAIVNSPFLAGAERESGARARLARGWAWESRAFIRVRDLCESEAGERCPLLARALRRGRRALATPNLPWPERCAASLQAMGWPGERPLSSLEFQTAQAWPQLLDTFASLEVVGPAPTDAGAVIEQLRALASRRLFQPEQTTGGVEIMGWLEATGIEFDHLWIAGLDDSAVPAPASPHPFLPRAPQVERGLPHATPEQETEFARHHLERLRHNAGTLAISYATHDGERQLTPSPLLRAWPLPAWGPAAPPAPPATEQTEEILDARAPAATDAEAHGGTGIFQDQAACPFRAFAHRRLHATAPGAPPAGLAHTTRGTLLHAVLESVFATFDTQDKLKQAGEAGRREVVTAAVAAVTAAEPLLGDRPGLAAAERQRLTGLVLAWFEEELKRDPYQVTAREARRTPEFAGLQLDLRLDRLDTYADGTRALLDYKSGDVSPTKWQPPRPDQPQLPIYAVTDEHREQIKTIAFAQLRPGEVKLKGPACADWSATFAEWEAELRRLASDFLVGEAEVGPKKRPDTCQYCDLAVLCRIDEAEQMRGPLQTVEIDNGD